MKAAKHAGPSSFPNTEHRTLPRRRFVRDMALSLKLLHMSRSRLDEDLAEELPTRLHHLEGLETSGKRDTVSDEGQEIDGL